MGGIPDRWRTRYAEFAARKTRAAVRAALPRYVTALDRHPAGMLAIGNHWTRDLFGGSFYLSHAPDPGRPAFSLVFVQSADGNTGADDPGTLGGGDTDKHLVYEGLSRAAADAVLAGAATIRGGDILFSVWHPHIIELRASLGYSRHPVHVVATQRGIDLEDALLFNVAEVRVVLLTFAAAMDRMAVALRARPWVTAVVLDGPDDLPRAVAALRSDGITRVSCVGGRTVARQLLDADLVDDVYLTTAPRAGGEPGTPLFTKPWDRALMLRKTGTGAETGVVFEHLVRAKTFAEGTGEADFSR